MTWPDVSLSDVAAITMGQSPEGALYNKDGIGKPLITGSGQMGDVYPCPTQFSRDGAKCSARGDIILSIRASIGDLNISDRDYYLGRGVAAIRCSPKLDSRYAWWALFEGKSRLGLKASGSTFKQIRTDDIERFSLKLPPIEEQRRIAAILDQAEALRAKRRQALAELDTLTQSLFLEMFGDPAINPMKWPTHRLGDIALRFSDGPFGSNLKSEHYQERGVRVIRLQNIGVNEFIDLDKAFISEGHAEALIKHECLPGDVLVGTLGDPNPRACLQPRWIPKSINKADCVQIRVNHEVATPEFVSSLLNVPSVEKMASGLIFGQTRLRIAMGRLRELKVPIPPIREQRRFSAKFLKFISLRGKYLRAPFEADKLSASLQRRAFRGEL